MSDDEQYQQHASQTYAARVSTLGKNGIVIIRGRPCKISEISKIGTNIHLVAEDIFTGRTLSDDIEPTQSVEIPYVHRNEYSLAYIDDGFLKLMTKDGLEKNDVKVPDGALGHRIQEDHEAGTDLVITVISAMGEEHAISVKEAAKND
ncbi:eukaryotic elongation factor 5A hypusine, DNA-binding OB fold-domain-containing protein [Aspergillus transmontanensis]|uniref:Eukaryotic translation initiation factor 5A n=1 Tax=Aspergillus transmontanensis TaxID=1034304 RepID=A0A5N6W3H6_9EURO|nr:eukaryotic elongation factor 5A hypusine, DNA-binding OB fold-domain-containing protein [Aspergillus transmontanensis]